MYFGEAHTSLDDKGRLAVPVQFRRAMETLDHDTWFVTRGYDKALFLFHRVQWDALLQKVIPEATLDPRILDFRRFFVGGASKAKLDGQGRLLIPQYLRDYAGIEREGVLLGMEDHLELWSESGWRSFHERRMSDYKQMAVDLFGNCRFGSAQPEEHTDHAEC
jgi:MraZ protein